MTKYTMGVFGVALLGAMLLTPNRSYLRNMWFWCGMGLALLIVAPNLWWQYQHHCVSLAWMQSIHARDIGRTFSTTDRNGSPQALEASVRQIVEANHAFV